MTNEIASRCPLCGADASPIWKNGADALMSCANCEASWLVSANGVYAPAVYNDDYYARNYLPRAEQLKTFFKNQLRHIESMDHEGKVLDVGHGSGAFLEAAVDAGWKAYGVESSEAAAAVAGKTLKGRATLLTGDFDRLNISDMPFDVVTFWDVLAHVPSPRAYLAKAHNVLDPSGLLVIKTPVRPAAYFRATKFFPMGIRKSLVHWPMQLFHFNEMSLKTLLNETGFDAVYSDFVAPPAASGSSFFGLLLHPRGMFYALVHLLLNSFFPERSLVIYSRRRI